MKTALILSAKGIDCTAAFDNSWLSQYQQDSVQFEHRFEWHFLPSVPNEHYDIVVVDSELSDEAIENSVCNWLRVLKKGGTLYLLIDNEDARKRLKIHAQGLSFLLERVETENRDRVILFKHHYLLDKTDLLIAAGQYEDVGRSDLALQYFRMALQINPMGLSERVLLTFFLNKNNLFKAASMLWEEALQQIPFVDSGNFRVFKMLNDMLQGDYVKGSLPRDGLLPFSRRCHKNPPLPDVHGANKWTGQDLRGKTFMVWSEFGLGDELMFVEMAYFFKQILGVGKLIWVVQKPLVKLVRSNLDIDEVVDVANVYDVEGVDYWDFPHSLPARIGMPFQEMPKRYPYLFVEEANLRQHFAELTYSDRPFKIGLAWRGDPSHENDKFRSIHQVEQLNILLDIPNVEFFCIQKEINEQEQQWLQQHNIRSYSNELNDFTDTAALLEQMDLLITVDTSIAHTAGAIGVPTFIVLPYVYDWRWGVPFKENYWYPNVHRFFQSSYIDNQCGNWGKVLQQVREAIIEKIQNTEKAA